MARKIALVWKKDRAGGSQLVLIPPAWLHRTDVPARSFLGQGWPIDPCLVDSWGLRPGDLVEIEVEGQPVIRKVNGLESQPEITARPNFLADLVGNHQLQFPRVELPIDVTGDVGMKVWRALAPLGLGSQLIIDGPASSGKTWTSQTLAKALLTCAFQGQVVKSGEAAFVFLAVGERPPDVGKLKEEVIGATLGEKWEMDRPFTGQDPFPGVHRELYFGFVTDEAVLNAQVALERARRLVEMGRHVFFFIDSIWGFVLALGGSLNGSTSSGLAAAGVPREALRFVKDNFLFSGAVPDGGSLTLIVTCLYEGPKTSSETVLNEIGAPSATARWRHRLEPDTTTPRPWVDLSVTGTRELDFMFTGPRLALHQEIQRRCSRRTAGPADRLAYLRHLFAAVPFDEGALRAAWASENGVGKKTPAERQRGAVQQLLAEAGAAIGKAADRAEALFMLMKAAGLERIEGVNTLMTALSEPEREELFTHLRSLGLAPKEAPVGSTLPSFLAAADALRNSGVDIREAARQALAHLGLTPELLLEERAEGSGPVGLMVAVLDAVAAATGRAFKKKERRAQELLDKGFSPPVDLDHLEECEVYQRLVAKAGSGWRETMETLLNIGPRTSPRRKKV